MSNLKQAPEATNDVEFLNSFYNLADENFAVIRFETDGTIIHANKNFCNALGYNLEEIVGKHHSMFVDPNYTQTTEYKAFWKAIAKGEAFNQDYKRIRKDGSEIWIKALYSPVKDSSGKVISAIKIAQDITEMKMASFLRQLVDLSPMNTMKAAKDGTLEYMNQSSAKTLKTLEQYLPDKVENLIGKSIDMFHKNPAHQQKIISSPSNLPHSAVIQLGPEKLDLLVSPVFDSEGEYIGPMVTWEVVTEKIAMGEAQARTQQMVDRSPINTMMADIDGNLLYMNQSSSKTLKTLEQYLPDKVENLIGKSIDMFHKNPAHQRKIIGDPTNLPHKATIQLGPEKLDLLVSPIFDKDGQYMGPMVTWEVVTEKLAMEAEVQRNNQLVEKSPVNTMMCDPEGNLLYLNERSKTTLKTLHQYLPVPVDELLGKSIDMFHKNPAHQRKIIGDPKNMPHKAIIQLGPEKLDLLVSAVMDNRGNFMGAMVNWDVVTDKVHLVEDLKKSADELSRAAAGLMETSNSLSAGAEETSAQANTASAASEEVNAGVQTVASNMEEMTAAIKEITKTTNESSTISNDAMKMANNTNEIIGKLGESSIDIGNVIKVISSIAQQTNLLALNATIEAARAGEAGKGFAVVANEVKELAKQTAQATQDITKKIENIQTDTKGAVEAIGQIREAIEKINSYAGNIAASVEEQAATTSEVTRIVTESAEGVKQINENIGQVSQAASQTGKDAMSAQEASNLLKGLAEALQDHVKKIEV
jgi:methyl-accepting chemotaxis protein